MSRKKLPPFGRDVMDLIKSRKPINELVVFIGEDCWDYAKWRRNYAPAVLVLPDGNLPQEYKWDVAKNLSVFVVATSNVNYKLVRSLAYELLRAQAYIVRAVSPAGSFVIFRQGGDTHDKATG